MLLPADAARVTAQLAKTIPAVREERKVFASALASLGELFGAVDGAVYICRRGTGRLHRVKSLSRGDGRLAGCGSSPGPASERWDPTIIASFFRNEKPELAANVIMAPVRAGRGSDVVGVLALARDAAFEPGAGKVATEILKIVGGLLADRRRASLLEGEVSVARAIARGVAAKDVTYRILHYLRRFIDYDHGATVLERTDDTTGRVVARQVAWTRGKSDIVGTTLGLAWSRMPEETSAIARSQMNQEPWNSILALREGASPEKRSCLAAALTSKKGCIGLIEMASTREAFFCESDVAVIDALRPYLAWCVESAWGSRATQNRFPDV